MTRADSLALIPARAGSKRLANKMLRQLGGKTLVEWTLDAVLASGVFARVIVSSDAEAILEPASRYPGVEARLRPAELASDTATTMEVLLDLLRTPERHPLHRRSSAPDVQGRPAGGALVALCQPATPFRNADDIRATVALMDRGFDSAFAVMAAPIPPQRSFPIDEDGRCRIAADSPLIQGRTRKQLYDDMYTPNGAIYVSTRAHLLQHGSFFTGNVGAHVMPRERSLDIDDEFDWQMAETLQPRQRP